MSSKLPWAIVLRAILVFGMVAGCGTRQSDNPFVGKHFYVDPHSDAQRQTDEWRPARPEDARQMKEIASQPKFFWFVGDSPENARTDVEEVVGRVKDEEALPVLVPYNAPYRDCGNYFSGSASAEKYRAWVRTLAEGDSEAVALLEPDALADGFYCLSDTRRQECLDLCSREPCMSSSPNRAFQCARSPACQGRR